MVAVDEAADVDDERVTLDDQPVADLVMGAGGVGGSAGDDRGVAPVIGTVPSAPTGALSASTDR